MKKTVKFRYATKIDEREVLKEIKNAFPNTKNDPIWLFRYQVAASPTWKDKRGKERQYSIGVPGMPDFIGVVKEWFCPRCRKERTAYGTFIGIECKGTGSDLRGGKLRPNQNAILEKIKDLDGIAIVYRPHPTMGLVNIRAQIEAKIDHRCYCDRCREEIKEERNHVKTQED